MRRAARTDANQEDIVLHLRAVGCSVQPLHMVGAGVPDLLVGYRGKNYLIEVKDGSKQKSERKLTAAQIVWHGSWSGQIHVAESPDEALKIVGADVTKLIERLTHGL